MADSSLPWRQDVYAGRSRLGFVEREDGYFRALAADETPIGLYETAVAATRAVCDDDRRRREAAS
jgi:hypothetical protein